MAKQKTATVDPSAPTDPREDPSFSALTPDQQKARMARYETDTLRHKLGLEDGQPLDPREIPAFNDWPAQIQKAHLSRYEGALAKWKMADDERSRHEVTAAVRRAGEGLTTGRNNLLNIVRRYRKHLTDTERAKAADYIQEQTDEVIKALTGDVEETEEGFTL